MKKLLFAATVAFSVFSLGLAPAQGQTLAEDMRKQSEAFAGKEGANFAARDPRVVAGEIIKTLLTLVGIIFVSYTVYGGFLIMTANGNDDRISKARSIITQGTIGVAIVLSSYGIAYTTYKFFLKADSNPFATYAGWGILPDDSGFYNTDPLEEPINIPVDMLPKDADLPNNNPFEP